MCAGTLGSVACVGMALLMRVSALGQQEKGLVGYYAFEKGAGTTVPDRSGRGNNGKIIGEAKWAKGPYGSALELDGKGAYVDCGTGKSLNIASGGTVMVWCCPSTPQGGLVNWSTGGRWHDQRLVLAIQTYHGGARTLGCLAHEKRSRGFGGFGDVRKSEWTYLAYTFDGDTVCVYRDGLLASAISQKLKPEITGVPLWIGRCLGLGKEYFHGLIDEVRIYSRPLSQSEILARYHREARGRGKDLRVFDRVGVNASACPAPGRILAIVDSRAICLAHEVGSVTVTLSQGRSRAPVRRFNITELPEYGISEVQLNAQRLPPGPYTVRARAFGPKRKPVGEESTAIVQWPGVPEAFKNIRVLNNLCWELLNVKGDLQSGTRQQHKFSLPCDRWIFIRTTGAVPAGAAVSVTINSDIQAATAHSKSGTLEAMRYLKAGPHTLHISRKGNAKLNHLIVRAIPALQHAFYKAGGPHIAPYGPYDWEFLKKDIRPNVNVMISRDNPKPEHIKAWTDSGRRWIGITNVFIPDLDEKKPDAVEKIYKHWSSSPGYQHPLMDGVIVDEFGGGGHTVYDLYRRAVERIQADPKYEGKTFSPYASGTFYRPDRSREFARVCIEGGGYVCPEKYLSEKPTREEAKQFIYHAMVAPMAKWEEGLPGVTSRMIIVLGYLSEPMESLNVDPTVDFKVYMDMQIRALATHPAFFGLGGIQEYHIGYCDEENARWTGRLYRHYCIEGNTQPLTKDPYKLRHIQNPDFADGTRGWTIRPAEADSIRTKEHRGYSWLEGRYRRTQMGDTFLLMKRSAKRPNVFSQEIKDLKRGRLYSMKMITGDYQDLIKEKSEKKQDGVTITLDGVNVLRDPKKNFHFTFPNHPSHQLGKFKRRHEYWMNYHWRVFRATATTAKLIVTDWKSDPSTSSGQEEAGGPIGQELMFNFIEIQPYIGD